MKILPSAFLMATLCLASIKGLTKLRSYNVVRTSSVTTPNYLLEQTRIRHVTLIYCSISCTQSEQCLAFDYDSEQQQCTLYADMPLAPSGGQVYVSSPREDTTNPLIWISAGLAGIFAIHSNRSLLFLGNSFGNPLYYDGQWQTMKAQVALENLDVGRTSVWGTNVNGGIFCYARIMGNQPSGNAWFQTDGGAHQVTVSDLDDAVWVVNVNGNLYYREGVSNSSPCGASWSFISYNVKYVTSGLAGLWSVLTNGDAAYTGGGAVSWQVVGHNYITIASGSDRVCAVDTTGLLRCRSAVSSLQPAGQGWQDVMSVGSFRKITLSVSCQLLGLSQSGTLIVANICL